ncbi:hypothetical protein KY285_028854 [Solanum tuberosum]|nr:hypothetical protein KY289_029035 [Solanum tuberosum]KAH0667648.1 hypothetical protein KY285_028854 [Solanum tuberosum]
MASFVFHQLKQITLEHGSQAAAYKSLVGEHSKVVSALRKSFNFHRDSIDLAQRRRIQLLICYADELTECFYPWIDQVAQIFIPLLKFWFHWEVSMPELLRFAKLAVEKGTAFGQNVTYVKQKQSYREVASTRGISRGPGPRSFQPTDKSTAYGCKVVFSAVVGGHCSRGVVTAGNLDQWLAS